jgi:hypothetical protein
MSLVATGLQYPTLDSLGTSVNLSQYAADPDHNVESVNSPISGTLAVNAPIDIISNSLVGLRANSFIDIYYYRLWIIENTVDFGRILSEQIVDVEAWNSFFEVRDFGPITSIGNTDGLVLSGDQSGTFATLESKMYELTAEFIGAHQFDVEYHWQFEAGGDTFSFLRVLGQRLVAFALRHNWATPILEQLSFKTDVLTGISGVEQRIKLRQTPRRRLEMSYMTLDAEEKAYLEQITQSQNQVYAVPLWQDKSSLQIATAIDATVFSADTTLRDYEVGGLVFLQSGDSSEVLTIESFTDSSITTTEGAIYSYPIGAKVCPARFGILEDKVALKRHTTHHEAITIPWVLDSNQDRTNQLASYTPDTHEGLDIYDEQNDYSDVQEIEQTTVRELLDNEVGLLRVMPGETYPKRDYPFSKLVERDEFAVFLQWFYDRSGKYEPFWWLDYTPAFHLRAGVAFDSVLLTVKTNGYVSSAFGNVMRRDIAINTSGGWIYRHIDDAIDNGDGTTTLTLDTAPGVVITVDEDPLICFLRKVRLDTDTAEIVYETGEVMRTAVRFKDVI